jgi:hypothetical protein
MFIHYKGIVVFNVTLVISSVERPILFVHCIFLHSCLVQNLACLVFWR